MWWSLWTNVIIVGVILALWITDWLHNHRFCLPNTLPPTPPLNQNSPEKERIIHIGQTIFGNAFTRCAWTSSPLLWCLCPPQTSGKSSPSSSGYSHTSGYTYTTRVLHCCQSWWPHPAAAVADDAVSQDGLEVSLGTLSCRSGRTSVHLRQMNFISDPSVPTGTSKLSWFIRGGGQTEEVEIAREYITHHGTCSTVTIYKKGPWELNVVSDECLGGYHWRALVRTLPVQSTPNKPKTFAINCKE